MAWLGWDCIAKHLTVTLGNYLRRLVSVARFASAAELESFLCELEPDYAQYASALWQHQVRTPHHLANASKSLLLSWGLLEVHVDDIKARANCAGEHLQCILYAMYAEYL